MDVCIKKKKEREVNGWIRIDWEFIVDSWAVVNGGIAGSRTGGI